MVGSDPNCKHNQLPCESTVNGKKNTLNTNDVVHTSNHLSTGIHAQRHWKPTQTVKPTLPFGKGDSTPNEKMFRTKYNANQQPLICGQTPVIHTNC